MSALPDARLLDPGAPDWPQQVDALRGWMGAPGDASVFPAHFLQVVLPRIGGHIVSFQHAGQTVAVVLLFPSELYGEQRLFCARIHSHLPSADWAELAGLAASLLPNARALPYDPAGHHSFAATSERSGGWDVGRPDEAEAGAIRELQSLIWGAAADNLYPADIHASDFTPVTSLVARRDGRVAGFLFGFCKFGGRPLPEAWQGQIRDRLRLESQVLGVHPEARGEGLATLLKGQQAAQARRTGIDVINWTTDPLLWPNAVLNFGRLGALALDFIPSMYPFHNQMNRVPASRLLLTWLVGSQRAAQRLAGAASLDDLALSRAVPVNRGSGSVRLDVDAPSIAVEIPSDWVALQAQSLAEALAWRSASDTLLAHYVGKEPGRYMITGVASQRERRYLLAQQVTPELLDTLARPDRP